MKPSDPPITDELAAARAQRIRVGIGGWNFPPWRNNFYPQGLPQRRELEFASRRVTSIEINSTFYRAQKASVYAKWRDETPPGFVFSLKAPRQVAEVRKLAGAGALVRGFVAGLEAFEDKLGPIVWQFPPSRAFERDDFSAFLDLLPGELDGAPLRHVLEVRNKSFLCDEYLELARTHRFASVFTDSDEYPNFADVTADFVYARLMRSRASEAHGYPAKERDAWAERARVWASGGEPDDLPRVDSPHATKSSKRDVFLYFISSAKARNPAAAMALLQRLYA